MYTTKRLLKSVRTYARNKYSVDTNYRVAKLLEVSANTVHRWDQGFPADDENALKISMLLKLNAPYVLACIQAERHKDTPTFGVWARIAEQLKPTKDSTEIAA